MTLEEQVARRRAALVEAWDLTDEVVLIGAGSPVATPRGRRDRAYPLRPHLV